MLSAEPAPVVTCEGSASVEARVWRSGSEVFLLAVNSAAEPVMATVSVAGGCKRVQAEFGREPERQGDSRLVYTFAPLEPVMVRLSGVP